MTNLKYTKLKFKKTTSNLLAGGLFGLTEAPKSRPRPQGTAAPLSFKERSSLGCCLFSFGLFGFSEKPVLKSTGEFGPLSSSVVVAKPKFCPKRSPKTHYCTPALLKSLACLLGKAFGIKRYGDLIPFKP